MNWAVYEFPCPADLNTAVEMTATFAFLSGGTDTDDYVFHSDLRAGCIRDRVPNRNRDCLAANRDDGQHGYGSLW